MILVLSWMLAFREAIVEQGKHTVPFTTFCAGVIEDPNGELEDPGSGPEDPLDGRNTTRIFLS